jgi:hypothetical protein
VAHTSNVPIFASDTSPESGRSPREVADLDRWRVAAFLLAYHDARQGRRFRRADHQIAWAAALWLRLHQALRQAASTVDRDHALEQIGRRHRHLDARGGRMSSAGGDAVKIEGLEGLAYVQGVNVVPVSVEGWQAWALLDTGPNGRQRLIAFLDHDALIRIHHQSGVALAQTAEAQDETSGLG